MANNVFIIIYALKCYICLNEKKKLYQKSNQLSVYYADYKYINTSVKKKNTNLTLLI